MGATRLLIVVACALAPARALEGVANFTYLPSMTEGTEGASARQRLNGTAYTQQVEDLGKLERLGGRDLAWVPFGELERLARTAAEEAAAAARPSTSTLGAVVGAAAGGRSRRPCLRTAPIGRAGPSEGLRRACAPQSAA